MKNGLPKHMDFKGNSLSKNADTEDSHSVGCTKTMVVPEKIVLDTSGNKVITQNNSSFASIVMEPPPKHMDALGNPLLEQPLSNLINMRLESKSVQKLSPAEELLSKLLASDRSDYQDYEQRFQNLLQNTKSDSTLNRF